MESKRNRLILFQEAGPLNACTLRGWQAAGFLTIALNLPLSKKIINLTPKRRQTNAAKEIKEILNKHDFGKPLLLYRFELLFLPEMALNSINLLEEISRDRTIVVAWPGIVADGKVSYATPDHPEYLEPKTIDAIII